MGDSISSVDEMIWIYSRRALAAFLFSCGGFALAETQGKMDNIDKVFILILFVGASAAWPIDSIEK